MTETNEDDLDAAWDSEAPGEGSAEDAANLPGHDGNDSPQGENGQAANGEPAGEPGGGNRRRRRGRGGGSGPRNGASAPNVSPSDDRSQKALEFVADILVKMEMDCSVEFGRTRPDEPNDIQLEISGPDSARIIGKKGQVLSALQYLTNRVVNAPSLEKRYVTVDAEGYRSRRDDTLATMARRLGKQAVTEGKIITFEPMNPRDRRVIHLALAKFDGVVTKSEGEGDDRRVQIIPVRR
jgi:spoIIIJ-associated protein